MLTSILTKKFQIILNKTLNHKGFMRYFKNTSWLFVESFFKIVSVLFVTIWIARYLGSERFGILSYAVSFSFFFITLATLGLDNIVVREMVKNKSCQNSILGSAFVLKITGASISLISLLAVVQFTNDDSFTNFLIFIIVSTVIFHSFNVIDFYNQANVVSKYSSLAKSIAIIISGLTKVSLVLIGAPLVYFVYTILFEAVLIAIGLTYFYKNRCSYKIFDWSADWKTCKSLLKDSWPLIFSGVLIAVYMKIDQIMIKEMLGFEANGQYAAAATLSGSFYFVSMVMSMSLFPAIINAKKNNNKIDYNKKLKQFYRLMIVLAVVTALPIALLSDWIVNILYGNQYNQASNILTIHIWASVFVFIGVANSKWFLSENLQFFSMLNTAIGVFVNVGLNYFFIKRMGVEGAAWATLASQFVSAYFCLLLFKKTRTSFFLIAKSLLLK